jgi:2,3-bisphosphoglycerate-independent phosphoglycerate mutase
MKRPLVLIILDGFGLSQETRGNAIYHARTPNIDKFFSESLVTSLKASGSDVGLPPNQCGNSEVGHLNIGAGRIVHQELTRINNAISDGTFFDNKELLKAVNYAKTKNRSLHFMGLLSDGGVHSHINHLFALMEMAKKMDVQNVMIHVWLDGRDTSPTAGIRYIELLNEKICELNLGAIASISGRYYAMDRDNRWERTKQAYGAIVLGKKPKFSDAQKHIQSSYREGVTDEFFIPATNILYNGMNEGDVAVCYNYRPDRVRQITRCLTDVGFTQKTLEKTKFNVSAPETYAKESISSEKHAVSPTFFVCMTSYGGDFKNTSVGFKPQTLSQTLGECISRGGLKQLRASETEKYAHITFFFNGGIEEPFAGEDRVLISSPKVATYDLQPEMSAYELTNAVIKKMGQSIYDFILINYANADMVGHTGNFAATVKAVEVLDECVGKLTDAVKVFSGVAIIVSDHGNAEKMLTSRNKIFTAHTANPVPFALLDANTSDDHFAAIAKFSHQSHSLRKNARISDVAPTILEILNLPKPIKISGKSLLV